MSLYPSMKKIFTHRPPKDDQPSRYQTIRHESGNLAQLILENCPSSEERDVAIMKIREAVMWANASIAINE